ncbi:MAG: hypothetical protein KDD69_17210, partial [Bdellovibrionales bacterium]|nr:hypothetical protein [Bdellovibrionales bacterium]
TADLRSVHDLLEDYEEDKNPKEVVNWLFRAGRTEPDQDDLVALAHWSDAHPVLFIKILDGLKGRKRPIFIDAFTEALHSSEQNDSFKSRFGHSEAPTVKEIIDRL